MNFAKGIAKLAIIGVIMVLVVWPDQDRFDTLVSTSIPAVMDFTLWLAIKLMAATVAVLTVIAALDWMYTRHTYMKRQRMTMREVRDEYKQAEGDPIVKAKLRQIRAERSRQRMMQRVPEASVIITNPTHYAVALKYEQGMPAPVCVAKGIDAVALRIREVGKEHDIAIVEDPPLAPRCMRLWRSMTASSRNITGRWPTSLAMSCAARRKARGALRGFGGRC